MACQLRYLADVSADPAAGPPPVLIAEDDPSIGRLLLTLLQRSGFETDLVHDGNEAIARIGQREYSVILLDLNMPIVDGFGVLDFLAARAARPRPIVLIVTAFDDRIVQSLDPDVVSGVLRKPFEVATITQRVAECVSAYQAMARETERVDAGGFVPPPTPLLRASRKRKAKRPS